MPTFDTPQPIAVTAELGVGDLRIVASDRTDTVVEVRPSDPAKPDDVAAARETRVEYANGTLLIKAPTRWRQYSFRGGHESIDISIGLPTGSHVQGKTGVAAIHCSGRLGDCTLKTGVGDVQVDRAETAQLATGAGDVGLGRSEGRVDVTTGTGGVRLGIVGGSAVIKNSSGDTWIGEVTGDVRVVSANGTISIDRAHATVAAKTANGDVRIGEVARGAVVAQTAIGQVDVGIREGVAAWLDLNTHFGTVHNNLEASGRPEPGQDTVEVRARTSFGDINVHRPFATVAG